MDMLPNMLWIEPPAFARLFLIAILFWPFLAPVAVRRRGDLRAYTIAPIVIGTLGASIGVLRMNQLAELTHSHGAALAFSSIENLMMPSMGATFSVVIAIVFATLPRIDEARRGRARSMDFAMVLAALLLIAAMLQRFAMILIAATSILLLIIFAMVWIRAPSSHPRSGRYAFIGIALAGVIARAAMWRLSHHYYEIAMGR